MKIRLEIHAIARLTTKKIILREWNVGPAEQALIQALIEDVICQGVMLAAREFAPIRDALNDTVNQVLTDVAPFTEPSVRDA